MREKQITYKGKLIKIKADSSMEKVKSKKSME
jgi:hypothetical protein